MNKSILIVDDDDSIRDNYKDILEDEGFRVTDRDSTDDLVSIFTDTNFDLVILDISMQGDRSAGHKFCKILKALNPEIPIVILTSLDDKLNRTIASKNGADGYWVKSASVNGFVRNVKYVLDK